MFGVCLTRIVVIIVLIAIGNGFACTSFVICYEAKDNDNDSCQAYTEHGVAAILC